MKAEPELIAAYRAAQAAAAAANRPLTVPEQEVAHRINVALHVNIQAFVTKIETRSGRGIPSMTEMEKLGKVIHLESRIANDYEYQHYFIWRKHNVLAWRHDFAGGKLIEFVHMLPDDWPVPVSSFIARLP